jgi:hypothetical protein
MDATDTGAQCKEFNQKLQFFSRFYLLLFQSAFVTMRHLCGQLLALPLYKRN